MYYLKSNLFFQFIFSSMKESHPKYRPDGLTKQKQSKWTKFANTILQRY